MLRHLWIKSVPVGLALLFASSLAGAEPSAAELAVARDMFNEARRAEEAGRWGDALVKLDAVAKVKMTPQVRFHRGLCLENIGKLVEALNEFERASSEGAEQNLTTVVDEAKDHTARVRARMSSLVIALPAGAVADVEVDGQRVAPVLLSRPLPINPGQHKIVASAPGLLFSSDVSIAEKEEKRVTVVWTPAKTGHARAPSAPVAAEAKSNSSMAEAARATSAPSDAPTSPAVVWGWTAVGVGAAALAGASVSALVRQGAIADIDGACPSHQNCPRSLEDSQDKARTFGALAVALGAAGGASVITGVVLLLTRSSPEPKDAKMNVGPWITASGAGAVGSVSW